MIHRSFFALCALLLVACDMPALQAPYHAQDVTLQLGQANFHLTDFNGKPRSLEDFKGKVVALFFGYAHCPEVCPTTLADLAKVMRMLGKDGARVQVLFITVDPEHDKPEALAKFIPSFNPSFLGLYGDAAATAQAAKAFGAVFEKQYYKNGSYTMLHSDSTFLIGPKGKPFLISRYGQRIDFIAQDIKQLLASGTD